MVFLAGVLRGRPALLGALVCGHAVQPQWRPFDQVVGTLKQHMPFGPAPLGTPAPDASGLSREPAPAPPVTPAPVASGQFRQPAPQDWLPVPGGGGGVPEYMPPDMYIKQLQNQSVFEDLNSALDYYESSREARPRYDSDYTGAAPIAKGTLFPKRPGTKEWPLPRGGKGTDAPASAPEAGRAQRPTGAFPLGSTTPIGPEEVQAERDAAWARGESFGREWPLLRGVDGIDSAASAPEAGRVRRAAEAFPLGPATPLGPAEVQAARPDGEAVAEERPLPRGGDGIDAAASAPEAGRARRATGAFPLGPAKQFGPAEVQAAQPDGEAAGKEWPLPRGGEGTDAAESALEAGRARPAAGAFPLGPAKRLGPTEQPARRPPQAVVRALVRALLRPEPTDPRTLSM